MLTLERELALKVLQPVPLPIGLPGQDSDLTARLGAHCLIEATRSRARERDRTSNYQSVRSFSSSVSACAQELQYHYCVRLCKGFQGPARNGDVIAWAEHRVPGRTFKNL